MSISPPIPEIKHFQNLTMKIQGQGQMTMTLHNYRSRQFHRTSNDINPSSGFRDMHSAKFGPNFWPMGKPIWGKWPWQCTTRGLDNSTELRTEKICEVVTEIWVVRVWQPPACPPGPWRQYPSSPAEWGVKSAGTTLRVYMKHQYIF